MKKSKLLWMCAVLMIGGLCSCNSDDDNLSNAGTGGIDCEEPSPTEESVVGYWQLVGAFHYDEQEPLTDIEVVEYRADGTLIHYKNGQQTSQTRYLLRAVEGRNGVFEYRCGESPNFDDVSTDSYSLSLDGDILVTRYYGCFNQSTHYYRRISDLNDVDPDVASLLPALT